MTATTPAPAPVPIPTPRPIRTAATLVVLRDGSEGLEALMLRRAEKANDQNSGASVFPGGVVDAHDRHLHALCAGLDDATASARLAVPEGGLDFYAAAIRECFEEAGLLFANDAENLPVQLLDLPSGELATMRAAAEQGTDALLAMCRQRGWCLAGDRVVYFGHWLTPPGMPRRFDTRFFVALMPAGQEVQPDGRETVEHMWLRPADALDPARGLKLMNVTRRVLQQLDAFQRADEFMAHARQLREIPLNMPRLADGSEGRRAVNIEEPAYDEIGHLDPEGRGDARYALEPGVVTRLSDRVIRVVGNAGDNSYLVGGSDGWALIGPAPLDDALRAVAPGPVRWTATAQPDWPGGTLDLGGATLQMLKSSDGAPSFLLVEERMLFTGRDVVTTGKNDAIEWIAPSQGFIHRPS
ncbi:8-oxo-dGTP pyrophosphatase MutT (NUDIX family) [Variovorax boronicumulans]|uniref:8-oxo-dGTP pyrophosphatase MutT (NUDIX family) n=1 Tax=Variovorax boronicumulans TaxID=436515 RepID=A0AAW8D695_9BURK|nr:NUDIX domain-containing protein [Variovorax boronicumulans]MDP9896715.1 8-oxo-dGTP pyrophosphatase MutT (NUDIX family) [Variovorax boronicumulans]MDQ0056756.1 8-oxo-dGTP pyrophosphatase MutT (NUDIX family) [Variovorax boronicumulans]